MIPFALLAAPIEIDVPYAVWHSQPVVAEQVVNDAAHADPFVPRKHRVKALAARIRPTHIPSSVHGASYQWHLTDSVWARYPAWVEVFAKCVSHHESWSPHMWTAQNPSSTASGGFQWLDGSWRTNLARTGLSGPPRASQASPVLQASVTAWVIAHHGQWNWNGSHCRYGT